MSSRVKTSFGLLASAVSSADSPPVRRMTPAGPVSSPRATSKFSPPSGTGPLGATVAAGAAAARRSRARIRSTSSSGSNGLPR